MQIAQDEAADALLDSDPFALLVGMLLDQQQPMERAFAGPYRICERLGWQSLQPRAVASLGVDRLTEIMKEKPAVHRFPASMAGRIVALAEAVESDYGGDCTAIWADGSAQVVVERLMALPGFGAPKAKIFLALLGKQRATQPSGWRKVTSPYGDPGTTLSVADVVDEGSLVAVRATKRELRTRST
ncbi:MAG: HhH-GPD-type base excision DNA repair protein [Candidatus Nanopelagicales bacterium]